MNNQDTEMDCWVSSDGKEIVLKPYDFMKNPQKKYREANWERANAIMNKSLTPIIVDGRNIYE